MKWRQQQRFKNILDHEERRGAVICIDDILPLHYVFNKVLVKMNKHTYTLINTHIHTHKHKRNLWTLCFGFSFLYVRTFLYFLLWCKLYISRVLVFDLESRRIFISWKIAFLVNNVYCQILKYLSCLFIKAYICLLLLLCN